MPVDTEVLLKPPIDKACIEHMVLQGQQIHALQLCNTSHNHPGRPIAQHMRINQRRGAWPERADALDPPCFRLPNAVAPVALAVPCEVGTDDEVAQIPLPVASVDQ